MTISLSRDFSVKPAVLSAAGNAIDANGLILTESDLIPSGSVYKFSNSDDVGSIFGTDSTEYKMSAVYFSGANNAPSIPSELLFYRYVSDAGGSAGWVRSAAISGGLQAVSTLNGTLILTIDGVSKTTPAIDLTAATSLDNAAQIITTGIGSGATATWNTSLKSFVITSATSGASSSVVVTGGTISDGLGLTASAGAITSNGSDKTSPTDTMLAIVNSNQDWVAFAAAFTVQQDDALEFATWANGTSNRYAYSLNDPTPAILSNQSATSILTNITANNLEQVIPTFGDAVQSAAVLAYLASIDFTATNGRASLKFTSYAGLPPTVTTNIQADNAISNGFNYYGSYSLNATKSTYYSDGHITGKFAWVDSWISNVWLNANIVSAFKALFTDYVAEPFNSDGYESVYSAILSVAQEGVNFGAIRSGVVLNPTQLNKIKTQTGGKDISDELFSKGWYFYIPPQPASNRVARKLTGAIFFYCDGGAIQSIDMISEDIQ